MPKVQTPKPAEPGVILFSSSIVWRPLGLYLADLCVCLQLSDKVPACYCIQSMFKQASLNIVLFTGHLFNIIRHIIIKHDLVFGNEL